MVPQATDENSALNKITKNIYMCWLYFGFVSMNKNVLLTKLEYIWARNRLKE